MSRVLRLLEGDADSAAWGAILAEDATFAALGQSLSGRDAVAERLGATRYGHLRWHVVPRAEPLFVGTARPDTRDRGLVLTIVPDGRGIAQVMQQNGPVPRQPDAPMRMDAALRSRFDAALAERCPMTIAYVDSKGWPRLSLRGSIRTFDDARLSLWARDASTGLAAAVRDRPYVALMYRNEATRATYQLDGRAIVVEDEATRMRIFAALPDVERQHDFARLGAAVLIQLDRVEGYAGLGPVGQIDPVRLIRAGR